MYTASTAFLDALVEAGVSRIFANFGSDHPGLEEPQAGVITAGAALATGTGKGLSVREERADEEATEERYDQTT